jgi:hypothetical protein
MATPISTKLHNEIDKHQLPALQTLSQSTMAIAVTTLNILQLPFQHVIHTVLVY